jgi:pimeloyl-ACP methyl ester carboxylesterase
LLPDPTGEESPAIAAKARLESSVHSYVPWGIGAISGAISEPAWRTKPSWYLVTTEDKMIPPDAQRAMSKRAGSTVVEVKGSHAIYVSQPGAVAKFIEEAARGAKATAN